MLTAQEIVDFLHNLGWWPAGACGCERVFRRFRVDFNTFFARQLLFLRKSKITWPPTCDSCARLRHRHEPNTNRSRWCSSKSTALPMALALRRRTTSRFATCSSSTRSKRLAICKRRTARRHERAVTVGACDRRERVVWVMKLFLYAVMSAQCVDSLDADRVVLLAQHVEWLQSHVGESEMLLSIVCRQMNFKIMLICILFIRHMNSVFWKHTRFQLACLARQFDLGWRWVDLSSFCNYFFGSRMKKKFVLDDSWRCLLLIRVLNNIFF